MTRFSVEEVRGVVGGRVLSGDGIDWVKQRIQRICLDTRSLRPGDLFVAIRGERFDGHDFVHAALVRGAVGAIVLDSYDVSGYTRKPLSKRTRPVILGVPDPLYAYQQLAAYFRGRFKIPLVAVTGSNGKTTTKEMVASVMAHRWKILKTAGNLNNRLGVPQTLFGLHRQHQGAVIESFLDLWTYRLKRKRSYSIVFRKMEPLS
jgi:UDP-N-acetylmuramoyl-tripeptide--D-alanyl-D-alanine ligase